MLSKSSAPAVADKSAVAAPENNTRVVLARSMASAGARAYNGDLGAEPPAGSRADPPLDTAQPTTPFLPRDAMHPRY